jgi:hypothetical protein
MAAGEHGGKGARHELSAKELKLAVYNYLRDRGTMKALPQHGSYVQLELDHSEDGKLVMGCRVWFTMKMEEGQDPKHAARIERRTRYSKGKD